MNIKEKLKTYNFWVSLGSAVFLILQIAGQKFGFYVDEGLFHDLFTSLCSILVILGIITAPSTKNQKKTTNPLDLIESATSAPQETVLENNASESKNEVETVQNNEDLTKINEEPTGDFSNDYINQSNNILVETDSFSIEPIISQNQQKETIELTQTDMNFQIENLVKMLNQEEEKFSENKAKYIEILETQISNLKNND